jgi:pimeloyl-ACP methyl ester carboxylesterase
VTLHHVRRGRGEPLVLIHGIGSSLDAWSPVLDALAAAHEVVAVDLPGFGASPPLDGDGPPTFAAMVAAAAGFISAEGLERPHVAGNSMGGWISLELARRGLVASATAISPAGFWSRREAELCRRSMRLSYAGARALATVAGPLCATAIGRTLLMGQVVARPWRLTGEAAARALRNLAASDGFLELLDDLTSRAYAPAGPLPVPVSVVWGDRDRLLLPRQARRAQRAIPGVRSVALPGAGHVPMSDDPAAVVDAILSGARV